MAFVKGCKYWQREITKMSGKYIEKANYREISNGYQFPSDYKIEILGMRDDKIWRVFRGFENVSVKVSDSKTIENSSSYSISNYENRTNTVVTTTKTTEIPSVYKNQKVPCRGCDSKGYKILPFLPLDRSKFNNTYNLHPHDLVLKKEK